LASLEIKDLNCSNDDMLKKYASLCLSKENYDYDKLAHQIEFLKLELGRPDFEDLFKFTYKNIKESIKK